MDSSNNTSRGTSTQNPAFSQLKGNVQYNTPPAALSSKVTDGGEYIVIARTRQSEEPQIWASGDETQVNQLFQQVSRQMQTS